VKEKRTVAALYVDTARGPYSRMESVECWGWATRDGLQLDVFAPTRDARNYGGDHPVIAHPPCGPWGRFWWNYKGGEGAKDCGLRAVEQVREFGGVLEHPAQSGLWKVAGIPAPGDPPDPWDGWTLLVQQCDWGHLARKSTWLYVVGVEPQNLPEFPPTREPTHVMVRLLSNGNDWPEIPKRLRHLTPPAFADWLVELARRVK
jgi:hypothetical protein